MSYGLTVTRDISVTGVQTVILPFKAKRIDCTYVINNTKNQGNGCYAENVYQRAVFRYNTSDVYAIDTGLIAVGSDSSNRAIGTVQNVSNTGFEINWTKIGAPTGTVTIAITALTH